MLIFFHDRASAHISLTRGRNISRHNNGNHKITEAAAQRHLNKKKMITLKPIL
jgi:hypothetical protein